MADVTDIPVVIFAGGRGTRFNSETELLPKPLIEVCGKPILGHIMDSFESQGFRNFIVLGGYLVERIHEYLSTRYECMATPPGYERIRVFGDKGQPVRTHVFDTGVEASTGDRLYSILMDFMPRGPGPYVLTYGDGLSDVPMAEVLGLHRETGAEVTMTAVHPPGRFGVIEFRPTEHYVDQDSLVESFSEKTDVGWINGGFMVVNQHVVMRYVPRSPADDGPFESFEEGALMRVQAAGKLHAYRWNGYWRCMDTRRDLERIEADVAANGGKLPWMK